MSVKDRHDTKNRVSTLKWPYPLNPPFAYATITIDDRGAIHYDLLEPTLSEEEEEALDRIKGLLLEELILPIPYDKRGASPMQYLKKEVMEKIRRHHIELPSEDSLDRILYYIVRDFTGYGKIDALMRDHLIEDISADGPQIPIYVWHREFESLPTNIVFDTPEELNSFVVRLAYKAGKHISVARPLLDATLPDGSRIQLTYGSEVTRRGSTFTVRKFRADPITIVDLIQFNTLSAEMAAYLWYVIENRVSVLIAGGIASGKTTMLNCLAAFIRPTLKIVSVEDTAELNIPNENWIPSVSRSSETERSRVELFDLLKASLRQRPDYIIVGEVRGEEAYVLFQAISIGHLGMSTIHAESEGAVFRRLKSKPMDIPEDFLGFLDVVTLQRRVRLLDKRFQRRTILISEVMRPEEFIEFQDLRHSHTFGEMLHTHDIFRWDSKSDGFLNMGSSVILERIKRTLGLDDDEVNYDLARREVVLDWMVEKGIRRGPEVGSVIGEFYSEPDELLERALDLRAHLKPEELEREVLERKANKLMQS